MGRSADRRVGRWADVILSEAKDLALGAQGKLREVRILDSDGVHRTPEIEESRSAPYSPVAQMAL